MAANNIYIQVDFNSQTAQQNVNALNQAIGQTGPTAEKSAKQATTALGSVNVSVQQTTRAFGELTTALAGLGIGRMVSSIVQVGSELGRAQTMMTAFTGSADAAAKVFDQIRAIAAQSPFRFKDLEETARTLVGFGMDVKEVPATIKIVSDQVAAMGGSIENVNSIVRIFGRVINKDFVGAMDLIRLLPQQGVKVMDALREAIGKQLGEVVSREDVQKYMKSGLLDPMETLRTMLNAMQRQTGGAGARINDLAKAFKNFGDELNRAAQLLLGPNGFGPALSKLGDHIQGLLAPFAALFDWLTKLPEPTKEWIVNIAAATAATFALAGAWTLFTTVARPAVQAIYNIGKALATALVAVLANPEVAIGMATIVAFVVAFAKTFPEEAKRLETKALGWATDLWGKLKDTIGRLAKESGLIPPDAVASGLKGTGKILLENSKESLEAVQQQVQEWSDAAGKTMLQALSSPVEAVAIKYKDLFDKLDKLMQEKVVTGQFAEQFRAQLTGAQALETETKLFEKQKQDIAERTKLDVERVKGSYDAQIAYIEAMDEQDLRKKVAAIDRITQLRVESAQAVARVEDNQLQQVFEAQKALLEANRAIFEKAGIDVDQAIRDRHAEMVAKQQVFDQKAIDETQKYRLEGWKKANDAIIEDQKRVYEAFKGEFDEIFDAFTQKTKSIGQALGDVFKKLALGEARNIFSSQAAAFATEAAGYGRPEEQITRGGGILSMLFQRGMPPRPPGPPPEAYTPTRTESVLKPIEESANRFPPAVDAFGGTVVIFARAVEQFAATASQGEAGREVSEAEYAAKVGGGGDAFSQAAAATGVSEPLLRAVAQVESGMRPGAVSSKGAMGLMQLMPRTAAALGITQPFNVQQNVMGGAQELGRLLKHYGGDVNQALAAYNYGQGNYEKAMAAGRPLPQETTDYVRQVQALMTQAAIQEAAPGAGFAQPTRVFQLPQGFSYDASGNLAYSAAAAGAAPQFPEAPDITLGPTPELMALAKQPSELSKIAGALGTGIGALSAGGKQPTLMKTIADFKTLFGIGGGAGGTTTLGSVLGSRGTGQLATLGGMALATTGLQRRVPGFTVGGGALAGLGAALQNPAMFGAEEVGGPLAAAGGLAIGAGIGLGAAGLQRGGFGGLAMTTAGGALAGAALGTTVFPGLGTVAGAAIGAAVGAIAGTIRLFVKTEQEKIRAQVKQVYGIDISNRQILTQIQQIVDSKYGGNVAVGIRSQDVQDIIRLYALSTGQAAMLPRPMYAATIAQSTQGMQLQPVYQGGVQVQNPYTGPTTYQYQTAVAAAGGLLPGYQAGSGMGVPGAQGIINQSWQQLTLRTIQGNPSAIAMASSAAASAGDSRLSTTQAMQEPLTALS